MFPGLTETIPKLQNPIKYATCAKIPPKNVRKQPWVEGFVPADSTCFEIARIHVAYCYVSDEHRHSRVLLGQRENSSWPLFACLEFVPILSYVLAFVS